MLTKTEIQKLAINGKIDEYSLLREYFQILTLKSFYNQPGSENTFFKGGTAIKLLFGSFRFSEDLDFTTGSPKSVIYNILESSLKDTAEVTNSQAVIKEVETVGNNFTFRLKFSGLPIASAIFIKTDFSTRESVLDPVTSVLTTPLPVTPLPIIKHLSHKEILSEKIRAIMHRQRGRDIFDLWFLLSKEVALDWKFINKKAAYYKETLTKTVLLERLNIFTETQVHRDLDKFLPQNYRKVNLDLVNKIKSLISQGTWGTKTVETP